MSAGPIDAVTSAAGKTVNEMQRFYFWIAAIVLLIALGAVVYYVASVRARVLGYLTAREVVSGAPPAAAVDNPAQPEAPQV